jgi:hypothetical protein
MFVWRNDPSVSRPFSSATRHRVDCLDSKKAQAPRDFRPKAPGSASLP